MFNLKKFMICIVLLVVSGCNAPTVNGLFEKQLNFIHKNASQTNTTEKGEAEVETHSESVDPEPIANLIRGGGASVDVSLGFRRALALSVLSDPVIVSSISNVNARSANVQAVQSQREFQVSGTIYGGVEDVTDKTSGVAAVLNARRLLFDGGKLDARIESEERREAAALATLEAQLNDRVLANASIWADLDRYEKLNAEIEARLLVLNPLISQLEKVAVAGVGDVSQVAAAQRTVSAIRVTQTDIAERLVKSRVAFVNAFGSLPKRGSFDAGLEIKARPKKITDEMVQAAPTLRSKYFNYLAAEADLAAIEAREGYDVGLEFKVSKPFAGSTFDSDESLGLVIRKNFFDGGQLEADKKAAEARVASALADINTTYRDLERSLKTAQQSILSIENAIKISRKNVELTKEEIAFLRKQLIIGGSTLDQVLSAEARLYDAESKEINLRTEKAIEQFKVLSALGIFSTSLGLSAADLIK